MLDMMGLNFNFDGHKHPLHALNNTERDFYCYYQTVQTTNTQYLHNFNNKVSVIYYYSGAISTDPGLAKKELAGLANPSGTEKQAATEAAKIKYLGVVMLFGADRGR